MSFLLQELYNLYLHLTSKFNLNMTTLYFFVNSFYLHLLEDKKKFRYCRVIIFRLLCNAMIWLVFKHFKKKLSNIWKERLLLLKYMNKTMLAMFGIVRACKYMQ